MLGGARVRGVCLHHSENKKNAMKNARQGFLTSRAPARSGTFPSTLTDIAVHWPTGDSISRCPRLSFSPVSPGCVFVALASCADARKSDNLARGAELAVSSSRTWSHGASRAFSTANDIRLGSKERPCPCVLTKLSLSVQSRMKRTSLGRPFGRESTLAHSDSLKFVFMYRKNSASGDPRGRSTRITSHPTANRDSAARITQSPWWLTLNCMPRKRATGHTSELLRKGFPF